MTKKKEIKPIVKATVLKIEPEQSNSLPLEEEKLAEQARQRAEFRWEGNRKIINTTLNKIDLSAYTITNLSKELNTLFDTYGTVKKKHLIDKDTPIQLINGGVDSADLTLGELMVFLKAREEKEPFQDQGLQFQTLLIKKYNENPFLHPLAKALNITKLDDEWLASHSFLTPAVYDLISKGKIVNSSFGMWNTDLEKAVIDFQNYKKVKKLVYQEGKALVVNLYANELSLSETTSEQ